MRPEPPTAVPADLPPLLPPGARGDNSRALQCAAVDIEEFYDADPRRRSSAEIEFGAEWRDAHGVRFEVSWVQDTGELYVMREPAPEGWATPFGGIHVRHAHGTDEKEIAGMAVVVVAKIEARDRVEALLAGWEEAMGAHDSVSWLAERLRAGGVLREGAQLETS